MDIPLTKERASDELALRPSNVFWARGDDESDHGFWLELDYFFPQAGSYIDAV